MTVAIVHYHFHRGGVQTVIRAQSQALTASGVRHVILTGSEPGEDNQLPLVQVPGLDYAAPGAADDPGELLATLDTASRDLLGEDPSIWHIHNHSLGKNRAVAQLPALLAERGSHLLLQIHDFAADGRPANFKLLDGCDTVYPVADQLHYAFINSRDCELLIRSGLPNSHCHLLPNAVIPPHRPEPTAAPSETTVLYPVRGIRRKNLGELCLLAALAPKATRFAVSLAPENPQWRPIFDRWSEFAIGNDLPVQLGVVGNVAPAPGLQPTFENWLAHSTHLVTTSIAEGFGLAFLEPVGLGLPLLGRDLPEITRDFKAQGIELGSLFTRLPIPTEWIDLPSLRERLRHELTTAYRSYQREISDDTVSLAWDHLIEEDTVDFGNLPEEFQENIITMALASPDSLPVSSWLAEALHQREADSPPEDIAAFSPEAYGHKLSHLYETVALASPSPVEYHPRTAVLDQFLEPQRFHFLRT